MALTKRMLSSVNTSFILIEPPAISLLFLLVSVASFSVALESTLASLKLLFKFWLSPLVSVVPFPVAPEPPLVSSSSLLLAFLAAPFPVAPESSLVSSSPSSSLPSSSDSLVSVALFTVGLRRPRKRSP